MADTEKKISELDSAAQINTDDITVLSQGSAGTGFASVKATILAIANKIVSGINFSSALQTTDKTITGAINEVAQGGGGGGASKLDDLDDVSISNPSNGQVLKYNSQTEEWENANESGGGSGGHTILDNDGTALAQEDDLQFAGTYSEDDSINGKTVVNITREMTQAAYDLLSADKKKGIIRITDDNYVCDGTEVKYSNGVSVKDKIDEKTSLRCIQVQFTVPTVTISAYSVGTVLSSLNIKTSTITDVFSNKTLAALFSDKHLYGGACIYVNAGAIPTDSLIWPGTNNLSIGAYNPTGSSINVSTVRLLVFCE